MKCYFKNILLLFCKYSWLLFGTETESTRSRSPSISSTPTASAHNSYIGEHPDERHFPGDEDLRHELENGVKLTPTTFLEDSMVVVADVNERYRSEHQIPPPLMGLLEVNKGNGNVYNNCSDSHFSGKGGTIYSTGVFFVQIILADRYIHRREF